jgi:hypothetical protein
VSTSVSDTFHTIVATSRATQLAAVTALAIGATTLPAAGAKLVAVKHTEAAPVSETTEMAVRRMPPRMSPERRRVRHAKRWRSRGQVATAGRGGGREASLVPELRALIADLRQLHGADSVRVISGRDRRAYTRSCHPFGQAFDAHVSRAVMADLRGRRFGLITYSGGMHHVHVSSCAREAGLRAHKRVGSSNILARYMARRERSRGSTVMQTNDQSSY